jgi:chemotaxis protein MotB
VQISALGSQLNAALAQVAAEQRRRAELEAERAARLEAENQDLSRYRSEFFGRMRDILADQDGVRIVGDRFVFSSEVLFPPGGVDLSEAGQAQLQRIASLLRSVEDEIPPEINWILRVDGHTDNVPIRNGGKYANNWELSQGRALSVVTYLIDELGLPPERLAATGFGEWQPIAAGDSPEARAQNRRIELKLTER